MNIKLFKCRLIFCKKGVTLIELLVVLVISAIVIAGIYKIFIAQTKIYAVQDQVAEAQQDVKGAMEIMIRDIRMAGYQTNAFNNATITNTPLVTPLQDSSITVNYEYLTGAQLYTITYSLNGNHLERTFQINGVTAPNQPETILTNVSNLIFQYIVDTNGDVASDIANNGGLVGQGLIPQNLIKLGASVPANTKILGVLISLTTNPAQAAQANPDVQKMVSPRTLTSVVTLRNMYFKMNQIW